MDFRSLFNRKKTDKTRQNLVVSIDDRLTGDHEVMSLSTTSTNNVKITFNANINFMSVHVDDLQDALNRIKDFINARTKQPFSLTPLGTQHLDGVSSAQKRSEEQEKGLIERIKPIPNMNGETQEQKTLVPAELETKEIDLSN